MSWRQEAKIKAAEKVVEHIKDDMIIGIGSGSTAAEGIRILGEKLRNGEIQGIRAVPTSTTVTRLKIFNLLTSFLFYSRLQS